MFFHNITNNVVLLCIKNKETILKPNEKKEIFVDCYAEVTLKHLYGSNSMPVQEIARDDADVSIVSAMLSSYKPPYFQIVLNSTFFIQGDSETLVQIRQQHLRPCYPCSYDRFYIVITNGIVVREIYSFIEKEEYTSIYKKATTMGTKKILLILLSIIFLFSVPMILGMWNFNHLLAIIASIVLALICCAVCVIAFLFSKFSNYVDKKTVLDNFESDAIAKYFTDIQGTVSGNTQSGDGSVIDD